MKGWVEKSIRPVTRGASALVCTPANWMPWSSSTRVTPSSLPEEIVVPPGAPVLAIGDRLEADRLLLRDQFLDLGILDGPEAEGVERAGRVGGSRLLQRLRPQQRSHLVGAERAGLAGDGGGGGRHGAHRSLLPRSASGRGPSRRAGGGLLGLRIGRKPPLGQMGREQSLAMVQAGIAVLAARSPLSCPPFRPISRGNEARPPPRHARPPP